jgi:hypothetical protein
MRARIIGPRWERSTCPSWPTEGKNPFGPANGARDGQALFGRRLDNRMTPSQILEFSQFDTLSIAPELGKRYSEYRATKGQ